MSDKKYEITSITHPRYPWLHRIRALRDIREDVNAGDLGGFVQSEENLSQEGHCWIADNAMAAEEAYVSGNAILWDYSCALGSATVSGESRIGGEAVIEDCAIVASGYIHGRVRVAGNAEIHANCVTGGIPVIMECAVVYGELGGNIEVHEHSVILPGTVIDNPTTDTLHIRPEEISVERGPKRASATLSPPQGWRARPSKKRNRGEER